jgi:hypothetical protein
MISYGIIMLAAGLSNIIIPQYFVKLFGFNDLADPKLFNILCGAILMAIGFWAILATRELRSIFNNIKVHRVTNLNGLRYLITFAFIKVLVLAIAVVQGLIVSNNARLTLSGPIILEVLFAVLFIRYFPPRHSIYD